MKCQQELRMWAVIRIVVTLVAVLVSTACHNNGKEFDNRATNSSASNSNEVRVAINPSNTPTSDLGEPTKPNIKIVDVPSKGAGPDKVERIAGTVSGVDVNQCKVVLFARTDVWFVQPYTAAIDTPISGDGKWENDTHLGSEYAALLVKGPYKPPATTGTLPGVGGLVLAIARVAGKH